MLVGFPNRITNIRQSRDFLNTLYRSNGYTSWLSRVINVLYPQLPNFGLFISNAVSTNQYHRHITWLLQATNEWTQIRNNHRKFLNPRSIEDCWRFREKSFTKHTIFCNTAKITHIPRSMLTYWVVQAGLITFRFVQAGLITFRFVQAGLITFRSLWPRALRRGSGASRLLRFRVRISPGTRMSISCECCVLSRRVYCVGLITRPEESYRVRCVWWWSLDNEEALAH
jgi:hypothetical protein